MTVESISLTDLFHFADAGLCVTLALEVASLRFVNDAENQAWVINLVRSLFAVVASAQLLHAAFTYRYDQMQKHGYVSNQNSESNLYT